LQQQTVTLSQFLTLHIHQCSRIVLRKKHIEQGELPMINGSCCCGAVKFELLTQPLMMGTCHCSRCRKVGASTIVFVKKEDL